MEEIGRGAEAIIMLDDGLVIKTRPEKTYRHASLDAHLRKRRTRKEAKVLKDLELLGVRAPKLISVDEKVGVLQMSFIKGMKLRDVLEQDLALCTDVGAQVAILHNHDLLHGDLTTSNMIVHEGRTYLIDFGLAFHSTRIEDKAVDLHLFKQALESKHHLIASEAWDAFLAGYAPKQRVSILRRLDVVEARGRNKHA